METPVMNNPVKQFTKQWATQCIFLVGDALWEFDREIRDEMDLFRQEFYLKEAKALSRASETLIT